MKLTTLIASAILVGACASTSRGSTTPSSAQEFVTSRTIISAPGEHCSITVSSGDREGLLTSIAAPFLYNLATAGFDAVGTAISSAAAERTETHTPPKDVVTLVLSKGSEDNDGIAAIEIAHQRSCVRTVFGTFMLDGSSGLSQATFPELPLEALTDPAKFQEHIIAPLNQSVAGSIEEINVYTEHLLEPVKGPNGATYYQVIPIVLWYADPVSGDRFKLTSMSLTLDAPGAAPGTHALSYSQTFEPNGVSPGSLYTYRTGGLSMSGLLPAPPLFEDEKSAVAGIKTAVDAYKALIEPEIILSPAQLQEYRAAKSQIAQLRAVQTKAQCLAAAAGKPEKVAACDRSASISELDAQYVASVMETERKNRKLSEIEAKIEDLSGELGRYNAGISITESRSANQFFAAIGKALTQSKSERDAALQTYVKSQLGVTADPSNTAAMNSYRSSKLAYDIARRKYQEAVATGDQTLIDTTLVDLVAKYNGLALAAETANIPMTDPEPYR